MVTTNSAVADEAPSCGQACPTSASTTSRMGALFSLSRFRSRLGTEMNEIIPNLFLGSLRDAIDASQLKKHRIQYVVSVHDLTAAHPAHAHLKVLKIQLSDCSSSDITTHFATTNQFIHTARLKHAAVLVHCLAGVSRSATVVAAYLITVCDLSFLSALSLISRKRPVINPNFGFRMQLCTYADKAARSDHNSPAAPQSKPDEIVFWKLVQTLHLRGTKHAASERLRLREHFGASAFDAQWAADRAVTRSKVGRSSCAVVCSSKSLVSSRSSDAVCHSYLRSVSKIDPQCVGATERQASISVSPSETGSLTSAEGNGGPFSSETASTSSYLQDVESVGASIARVSLPLQKIIVRAHPLPQSHMVQVLNLVHNPVLTNTGSVIDD